MAGQEPSSPTARGEGVLAEKIYVAQRPVTPADRANRWVRGKASASWHLFYGWLKPRLNWPSVKVVLRATIATWCGFILQLDSSAIRVLGHAAFLTLVVGVIDSCDRPLGRQCKVCCSRKLNRRRHHVGSLLLADSDLRELDMGHYWPKSGLWLVARWCSAYPISCAQNHERARRTTVLAVDRH